MRNWQDKDDDVQNQVGKRERQVERQHHNAAVAIFRLELFPQRRRRGALEGEGEDVRDAPAGRQADDDVVEEDEDADPKDAAEEEEHRELDKAESGRPNHLVRVPRLLVNGELRRVARQAVLVKLLMAPQAAGRGG